MPRLHRAGDENADDSVRSLLDAMVEFHRRDSDMVPLQLLSLLRRCWTYGVHLVLHPAFAQGLTRPLYREKHAHVPRNDQES